MKAPAVPVDAAANVDEGRATKGSVCVAFGPPLLDKVSVTGSVPSAIFMWLIVRLNIARAATAVHSISRVEMSFWAREAELTLVVRHFMTSLVNAKE